MGLKQQIIDQHIEGIALREKVAQDIAFIMYAHSLAMGRSSASFEMEDIVDGGQDKQIDACTIEEGNGRVDLYITQATTTDSFSSTKLIQLGNGLRWLFEANRTELSSLPNLSLRDKILQFREVQSELGPANINIHVNFIAKSDASSISQEFKDEQRRLETEYGDGVYESFTLNALGIEELTELSKARDRRIRSVNAELKIRYDRNTSSVIDYFSQGLKGAVCTIPAAEIAKLVNKNPEGAVFDANIRQYLGARKAVNKDIRTTATGEESFEFWFLNNGITIVCDKFDVVRDPDTPKVIIENLQIVNGCQTASTLAQVAKDGDLKKDTNVIVRIYETNDENLVGKIVLTTNNQNQITTRNLSSNDPMQVSMEEAFKIKNYFYERKPGQFEKLEDTTRLYTNEEVGQAYLALVLKNPADARSRRYKIWDELNLSVFSGAPVEQYIFSSIVVRLLSKWLRKSTHYKSEDNNERTLAKRGLYHIGRVVAYELVKDNWQDDKAIEKLIKDLEKEAIVIESVFEEAFQRTALILSESGYANDIERGIKSYTTNKAIEANLYSK